MWTLGFALGGCDWAIKIVTAPEYDLRSKMIDYNKRRNIYFAEREIESLHERIDVLLEKLARLKSE